MAPCRKLLGRRISSSPLKRRPVSLSFCYSILASLSAPAKVVAASSFLLALTFTSLHTRVWDSKINLFRDAVFPGFNGMECSNGCNCASVGVCPGWQATNASLANDVIPLVSRAFASACDSATSSALLFRAFTDSKGVPISKLNLEKGLRMKLNETTSRKQMTSLTEFRAGQVTRLFLSGLPFAGHLPGLPHLLWILPRRASYTCGHLKTCPRQL